MKYILNECKLSFKLQIIFDNKNSKNKNYSYYSWYYVNVQ